MRTTATQAVILHKNGPVNPPTPRIKRLFSKNPNGCITFYHTLYIVHNDFTIIKEFLRRLKAQCHQSARAVIALPLNLELEGCCVPILGQAVE